MNGVSLQTFRDLARQDESGTIALDKNDESRIINNKGTLGRSIVSGLKDLGEALGLGDATRARRQQEAFDVFKGLLTERFGEVAAQRALSDTGLDKATRLTGADVDRVILQATRQHNALFVEQRARMDKFDPPIAGDAPSEAFERVLASFDPPLDASHLSDQVRTEYAQRLSDACTAVSNIATKPLDDEQIHELARGTLKHVLRLEQRGQLDDARAVRDSLKQGWKDLLAAVGAGAGPHEVMQRLEIIQQRTGLLVQFESAPGDDVGSDFFEECAGTALIGALRELRSENRDLVSGLSAQVLDDQGAIKSLFLAAHDSLYSVDGHASQTNLQFAGRLHHDIGTMVKLLGSALGATHGTVDNDMDSLERNTLSEPLRRAGAEAFQQARMRQFDAQRDVLENYMKEYGEFYTDEETPPWFNTEALVRLEQRVLAHAEQRGVSPLDALRDMHVALDGMERFPPGLKERIGAALNAIEAGFELEMALHDHPVLKDLAPQDYWRLFAPGNPLHTPDTKWELEQNGEGSLAAMQRAFLGMLSEVDQGGALDDQWLERIQAMGSKDTYRNFDLRVSYKPSLELDESTRDMARELRDVARVPTGYRGEGTDLTLRLDSETTPAGREALRELASTDPWFAGVKETDTAFGIELAPKTPQECRERARAILHSHEHDMARARTDEEKLRIVARTTQSLYRSHVFMDGNTRTSVFSAMNGLLLKAGLSPCILPEPKAAAGYSLDEFVQEIIEGQAAFAELTNGSRVQ